MSLYAFPSIKSMIFLQRSSDELQQVGWDINPFLPTGQFIAPKLIILIKFLIDILFFKVLL